jgi:hypothetical protein
VQERTQREVKEANERRISARVVNLAALAERFPSVFNADKPLPLAIRTDKAVREALALPCPGRGAMICCIGGRTSRRTIRR